MGRRGPGAKPTLTQSDNFRQQEAHKPDWRAKGLSRAQCVIRFIEGLKITAGTHAGKPFKLRKWQKDIIRAIYKTRRGKRLIRTALITMPRKNGKTALSAALGLCHLVGPEAEQRGQVYSAAADRAQAALIFEEMKAMIDCDPELSARIVIRDFNKMMEDDLTGSTYHALSSDARTKHGFSASFIIYDELAQAPNRNLYDVLTTSTAARAEPLTIVISTQNNDPHHIMSELVNYGGQVNAGIIQDETFHATIYEAPESSDPWDEKTWHDCNPALDDFRSISEMRTFAKQAQRIPAKEAVFRNLYLNQRIEAEKRFIPAVEWDACRGEFPDLTGVQCFGGLDLGSTRDLTSFALFFPEGGYLLSWNWCPGERLSEREDMDRVPYVVWGKEGLIEATPGRGTDKRFVACRLAELKATYNIRSIAYDRWSMPELERILSEEGIILPLMPFGQGFKDMGPAVNAFESLILNRKLKHDGNPVLTWALSNAVIETDPAGNRKLSKSRARERIDPLVAAVMAIGLASREPEPKKYDFNKPMVIEL